jgi:hypothetical protein
VSVDQTTWHDEASPGLRRISIGDETTLSSSWCDNFLLDAISPKIGLHRRSVFCIVMKRGAIAWVSLKAITV